MFPIPTCFWDKFSPKTKQRILFGGIILVIITATLWLVLLMYKSYNTEMQKQWTRGYNTAAVKVQQQYDKALQEQRKAFDKELASAESKAQQYFELSQELIDANSKPLQAAQQKLSASPDGNRECFGAEFMQEFNQAISAGKAN